MTDKVMTDENGRTYHLELVKVDHSTTDWGQVTLYNDAPKYWCTIVGMIGESIHQGFDGWSKSEQDVIQRYLEDIMLACNTELNLPDAVNIPGPHPNRQR